MRLSMWNNSFNSFKAFCILIFVLALASCGGDDPEEVTNSVPSNLQLDSLQFEQHDINFNKNKTGPYEIVVNSETASIKFNATNSSEDTTLRYQVTNSDDSSSSLVFESGSDIEINLAEGGNLLRIIVADNNSDLVLLYTVTIAKASTSAGLNVMQLREPGSQTANAFEPAFSSDVFSYSVDVAYEACTYRLNFVAGKPDNEVQIEGLDYNYSDVYFENLEVGSNSIELVVYSGEEISSDDPAGGSITSKVSEARYNLEINRAAPSEEETNANANLKRLSIDGHDFKFLCSQSGPYGISVSSDAETLNLTAEAEIDGVEILYGDQTIENNVATEIPLAEDTNVIEITVNALDESSSKTYQLIISRFSTNRKVVETVEELQQALQNAQPNDEIRIKPGEYEGIAGLETSGSDNAAFYSAMSGSRLLPIILTSDNTGQQVILKAAASEEITDVLQLAGDYWQVANISVRNGDTGVHLNNANNVVLGNLDIDDVNLIGVDLSGSNNRIADSDINVDQNDQQDINSIAAAVRIKGDSENNLIAANNSIYRNKISASFAYAPVLLDVFSENTELRQNEITSSAAADTPSFPLVEVKGNNSTIRFNHFAPSSAINSAIAIEQQTFGNAEGAEETSWGNAASIYQNTLDNSFDNLLFVQANDGQEITAGENYLTWLKFNQDAADHTPVSYEGGNLTPQDSVSPRYRISPFESQDDCLSLKASEDENVDFVVELKPCGEGDEFYWSFEYSSKQNVYIKNRSVDDGYLSAVPRFVAFCPSIASATSLTYLTDNVSGFAQQWAIYNDEDGYWFTNKFNNNYVLSVGGETYGTDTPLVVCPMVGDQRQKFILKP